MKQQKRRSEGWRRADHNFAVTTIALMIFFLVGGFSAWMFGNPGTATVEAPPPPKKPARTGMTVEHPKYGTGTVVRREGEGDDAKITVSFQRYGLKKLVEKYAQLKKT